CAAVLAWASLNQLPYAHPVYFLYAAPLAVIAAVAVLGIGASVRSDMKLRWALMLVIFAVMSAHRGYIGSVVGLAAGGVDAANTGTGPNPSNDVFEWSRLPVRFEAPLDLPRAHLNVDTDDARMYRGLVASIEAHLRGGQL